MKRLSMLLIPCIAISANAATFNAQGKIINSKDAKNPGIVKFEKDKTIAAESNASKINGLAKTATPAMTNVTHVTPYSGRFSTNNNSYSLTKNGINIGVSTKEDYLRYVDALELEDEPRINGGGINGGDNTHPQEEHYKSRDYTTNECEFVSTQYNYNAFFNDAYTDILNGLNFHCTGTCGNEINVYNVVPGKEPITFNGNSCVDPNRPWTDLDYSYRIQHYSINQFFAAASPSATLHTISENAQRSNGKYMTDKFFDGKGGFPWNFFVNAEQARKAPHIINIVSSSKKDVSLYNIEAAKIDDYIYNTRSINFAAYTEEGKKTGPGTALNAITVSPVNSDGYILERDDVTRAEFINASHAGIAKPEIYSLSYAYNSYNDLSRKIKHDNGEYDILGITDSWGASTTASAMAADLLSKYPFYKWHPELVKALMKTANNRANITKIKHSNINDITAANILSNSSTTGAHLTLFEEMTRNNVSRYWYGNNNDFFYEDKMSFTENVDRGGKYNIAIAWLVSGKYAWENKLLSSQYSFKIYNVATGKEIAQNTSTAIQRTIRYNEIDIPSNTSKIRVEIERTRNTGDRVILGFNMHKVTQ